MTRFQSHIISEDDLGHTLTIVTLENSVAEVVSYIKSGAHEDFEYVLKHGTKLSEQAARRHSVAWPARLTYQERRARK